MPLQDEERLFIAAMRDLNHQASRMQAEEKNGTGSSLSGDENDHDHDAYQDQSNDDSDASSRSPSTPYSSAQYLSAMGPHVVPHDHDGDAKTVTEDCVSLPARLPLPTHMPQMPANAVSALGAGALSASVRDAGTARPTVADAIAAATASVVDAAMRLSTACPPGPHTHACGSGTTTYTTSTTTSNTSVHLVDASVSGIVETNTVDNTSMINSGGPVAPGKEGHSERCSVTQEVREGEFRPLKRSAVDAGLI